MSHPARTEMAVSVIVPARNAAGTLSELLTALEKQTLPRARFEVIIGDDGSTDGTAVGLPSQDGWIRVTSGPPLTSYAARNRAASLARARIYAFCDADCEPEPEWLENGIAAVEDADLAAGRIRFRTPDQPTVWTLLEVERFKNHERDVELGQAETANLFVRADVFWDLGGFDPSLPSNGDYDFVARCLHAGKRLVYAPDSAVRHSTRSSAGWLLKKTWISNVAFAMREVRRGRRPWATRLRWWVPVVPLMRSRRRRGFPLGIDRTRMESVGLSPSVAQRTRALLIMYFVLPYVEGAAQLYGYGRASLRIRSRGRTRVL
jgi:glycosyltransferase involved in cell wall biosynthesis